MEYLYNVAHAVISSFSALQPWQQAIYVLYIMSGLFGPLQTMKQAHLFDKSNDGIGATCIKNATKQMLWRLPPWIASFTCWQPLVFPLFWGVGLDIISRCVLIRAAIRARDRAAAAQETKASNDDVFEAELDAA